MAGQPFKNEKGEWFNRYGEKITPDEAFSDSYWEDRKKLKAERGKSNNKEIEESIQNQKKQMAEIIKGILKPNEEKGEIHIFVDKEGIKDEDKKRLSAYRILAKEIGYEIGLFKFNKNNENATAEIKRIKDAEMPDIKKTEDMTEEDLEKRRKIISPLGNKRSPK